jgi:hypothetical protein
MCPLLGAVAWIMFAPVVLHWIFVVNADSGAVFPGEPGFTPCSVIEILMEVVLLQENVPAGNVMVSPVFAKFARM